METAVMDSSPGLYLCASPNLAQCFRSAIAGVTFFVSVCTRTFFTVRTWKERRAVSVGW